MSAGGLPPKPKRRPAARGLNRRGTTSLELAIVAMPLFLLILGGLELARYSAVMASLRAVVDEAVRRATLTGYANLIANGAPCTGLGAGTDMLPSSVQTYLVNRSNLSMTVDSCATSGAVTTVTMTARYQHSFLLSLLAAQNGTFVETATAAFN